MKKIYILLISLLLMLSLCSCSKQNEKEKLVIAEQYGLAYAPIQIMKEKGYLEALLPDVAIEWTKLSNTTAIREAMLSSDLDIGFMAIPPFLIGKDNGMDWKIITGLSQSPLGLVSNDASINSLEDFTKEDKIALPQPGSIQHILLAMACEKELGQADQLDNLLVSMNHPDGMAALEAKSEIKAHFTSPPYLFLELENEENHLVLTGEEGLGSEFTFIIGVCNKEFYENERLYKAFNEAITKAIHYINENQSESIAILSESYDIDEQTLEAYLNKEGMKYSNEVMGIKEFSDFMLKSGYIDNSYEARDLIWE